MIPAKEFLDSEKYPSPPACPTRYRLPRDRISLTHKFSVGGEEGYMIYSKYPDGHLGEIFVRMNKEGSTISGLLDSVAKATSVGLQHGLPLAIFIKQFTFVGFPPNGITDDKEIPFANSVLDYLFRWLDLEFPEGVCRRKAEDAG